jgi:shikimate dehydrogenase
LKIVGTTKIVALLGYPVGHSLSPGMHNAAFEHLGLDYCYVAFPVRPDALGEAVGAIRALNMAGANITVPHKENAVKFLDEVDKEASFIGAVNTVVNSDGRLKGYNTDGRGFMRSLSDEGITLEGKKVLIIGTGGASRAIGYYISKTADALLLYDIDGAKARRLRDDLLKIRNNISLLPNIEDAGGMDIIINATPLGLKETDPLPLDLSKINPSQTIGDLIYKETRLLKEAGAKGCETFNGLGMLLWQGVFAFELWTGIAPPHGIMRKALLKLA